MTAAADWTGKVGDGWAAEWRRTDRSFAALSVHLDAAIEAAAPPDAIALDIGCGAGATSLALATRRPDVTVTGLDLSADLIAIARRRGEHLPNARFAVADAAELAPDADRSSNFVTPASSRGPASSAAKIAGPRIKSGETTNVARHRIDRAPDLLFSRHGVMFFADPVTAFAQLATPAAPGAALVFSTFRDAALNPWANDLVAEVTGTAPSSASGYAPGPFGFADRDRVTRILADAGWRDSSADPVDYRYVAGAGHDPVADAVSFLRRIGPVASALRQAPDDARVAMLDKLAAALHNRCDHGEVAFPAAAWIWRARATEDRA